MDRRRVALNVALALTLAASADSHADEQAIPPGVHKEDELSVDSGPDGICNTAAAGDDVQLAPVGSGLPDFFEIGCGPNNVVDSTASGDDVQLRPVNSTCANANVPVVHTGANGVANTALAGDDIYLNGATFGAAPPNTPCVGTGDDATSNSTAAGDDVQAIALGMGNPGAAVVLCGDDLIPSTTANNAGAGDDVQAIPVSGLPTCGAANDVVVSSGPLNSISSTRAEGSELVMRAAKPAKVTIKSGDPSGTKTIKLQVYNQEFGANPNVQFQINADDGNCPDGTLTLVDADPTTDGLQALVLVDQGDSARIEMDATFYADRVRTVSTRIPFRCEADVTVVDFDTAPEEDDARVRRNNSTKVTFEVYDLNDLP